MEQRISLVTLGVRDLPRSRAFYEALGWKRSGTYEGVAFFQTGCMALGLYPRDALAEDANVARDGTGFAGFSLAQNVASREAVDAALDEAVAAGAALVKPAQDAFWGGYHGYWADPDGFLWEIAWNPGFTLAADGSITLPG